LIPALLAYITWLPALMGFGTLVLGRSALSATEDCDPSALTQVVVAGFALFALLVDLLNFVLPISGLVSLGLLVFGWALLLLRAKRLRQVVAMAWSGPGWLLAGLVALLVLIPAYVMRFWAPDYDQGLYYLQSIRWIGDSKLPVGLANLYDALGYNQSWFSITAGLQTPWLIDKGSLLLNGLLFIGYGTAILLSVARLLSGRFDLPTVFLALTGLPWLTFARPSLIGSANPDMAITYLTLLLTYLMLRVLTGQGDAARQLAIAIAFVAFATTVKLSGIALIALPAVTVGWIAVRSRSRGDALSLVRGLRWGVLAAAGLLVPWSIRGVLLSGCFAYPVQVTCVPSLPWTIPESVGAAHRSAIIGWSRSPGVAAAQALDNWHWVGPWFGREFAGNIRVRLGAGMLLAGAAMWLASRVGGKDHKPAETILVPGVALLAGLVFWFLTAPAVRFGEGYIWGLPLLVLSAGVCAAQAAFGRLWWRAAVGGLAVVLLAGWGTLLARRSIVSTGLPLVAWPQLPTSSVQANANNPDVYSPRATDQCWNTHLPCTPILLPELRVQKDRGLLGETWRFEAKGA
ncbi:MAG TPA: hypothetical protein VKU60_20420, partial [Chloroflexota bacterium]|nr:hypothetical protein [Chloroflexota bacterium]